MMTSRWDVVDESTRNSAFPTTAVTVIDLTQEPDTCDSSFKVEARPFVRRKRKATSQGHALMTDSSDEGESATENSSSVEDSACGPDTKACADKQVPVLPPFTPKDTDGYIKPQLGSLVTHIWSRSQEGLPIYRTGVLTKKSSTLRFFRGPKEKPKELSFYLTRRNFELGNFRLRNGDLKPGNYCFDCLGQVWYRFVETDERSGGVRVQCIDKDNVKGGTCTALISPDDLVGISPDEYQSMIDAINPKEETSATTALTVKAPTKKRESRAKEWIGVFSFKAAEPSIEEYDSFYIRGKLRERKEREPLLVHGESVRYHSTTGKVTSQMLFYSARQKKHLLVQPGRQYNEYKREAIKAEELYAENLRKDGQRRLQSSLSFRPLQPVLVDGAGEAEVIVPKDESGWVKVRINATGLIETKPYSQVKLLGKPDPICLEEFFRVNDDIPTQKKSYRVDPDFLLKAWTVANREKSVDLVADFERRVEARDRVRLLATGSNSSEQGLSKMALDRLLKRSSTLLERLQEDYRLPKEESLMTQSDFRSRIVEVKNVLPRPNWLLLCGGIAPEVTAYKRLGAAPLGKVIIQDTDLYAVGVAVAAHPDVEFAIVVDPHCAVKGKKSSAPKQPLPPGDVRILRNSKKGILREIEIETGGIHNAGITNPCTSFSKAGKMEGFETTDGMLLIDCVTIVRGLQESSDMPVFMAENVWSTIDLDDQSDDYLPDVGSSYFRTCGSICSPSMRRRKFATNLPPVVCASGPGPRQFGEPPSLNGDRPEVLANAVVANSCGERMVHPGLKKFPCLMHSGSDESCVWQRQGDYKNPVKSKMNPEEAERAMGYSNSEIGVTSRSAYKAVLKRIREHDVEKNGCIVSLKDCAKETDLIEHVDDKTRLRLLGNSQIVTLLEALMWNERRLFPGVTRTS